MSTRLIAEDLCDLGHRFFYYADDRKHCPYCQIEAKDKRIAEIQAVVKEQAENAGLWFIAKYATEAYLQSELRRLHAVIEGKTSDECARETLAAAKENE